MQKKTIFILFLQQYEGSEDSEGVRANMSYPIASQFVKHSFVHSPYM